MAINFSRKDIDELEFNMNGRPIIDTDVLFSYPDLNIDTYMKEVIDTYKIVSENVSVILEYGKIINLINGKIVSSNNSEIKHDEEAINKIFKKIYDTDNELYKNIFTFISVYLNTHINSLIGDSINNINAMTHINDPEPEFDDNEDPVFESESEINNQEEQDDELIDDLETSWDELKGDILEELGYSRSCALSKYIETPEANVLEWIFGIDERELAKSYIYSYIVEMIETGSFIKNRRLPKLVHNIEYDTYGINYDTIVNETTMYSIMNDVLINTAYLNYTSSKCIISFSSFDMIKINNESIDYIGTCLNKYKNDIFNYIGKELEKVINESLLVNGIIYIADKSSISKYILEEGKDILNKDNNSKVDDVTYEALVGETESKEKIDLSISEKYHEIHDKGFQSSEDYHSSDFFRQT